MAGWQRYKGIGVKSGSLEPVFNPYRMTGGSDRDTLIGWDQFLLLVFHFIYPEAQADEIAMFIFENGEGNVYSRSVVSRRLRKMHVHERLN